VCPTHGAAKGAGDSAGDARSDAKVPVGHQGNESMVSPVAVVGPDGQPKGATLTGAEHMTAQVGRHGCRRDHQQAMHSCV
jgi:hypothetical protein